MDDERAKTRTREELSRSGAASRAIEHFNRIAGGGGGGSTAGVGPGHDGAERAGPTKPHHHHRHTCRKHKERAQERAQERALRDATAADVGSKPGRPGHTNYEPIEVPERESGASRARGHTPAALPTRPARPELRPVTEETRPARAESRLAEEPTGAGSQAARAAPHAAKTEKAAPERPPGPPVEQLWPKHWGGRPLRKVGLMTASLVAPCLGNVFSSALQHIALFSTANIVRLLLKVSCEYWRGIWTYISGL